MGRRAPWTDEEAENIRAWQSSGLMHPLTCPHHSDLVLRVDGDAIRCEREDCDYEQTWVPTAMTRSDLLVLQRGPRDA